MLIHALQFPCSNWLLQNIYWGSGITLTIRQFLPQTWNVKTSKNTVIKVHTGISKGCTCRVFFLSKEVRKKCCLDSFNRSNCHSYWLLDLQKQRKNKIVFAKATLRNIIIFWALNIKIVILEREGETNLSDF